MQKHIIRSATLGFVPDAVNDVAFHHAHVDFSEIVHVVQDTATIGTMTLVLGVLTTAASRRKISIQDQDTGRQNSGADDPPQPFP